MKVRVNLRAQLPPTKLPALVGWDGFGVAWDGVGECMMEGMRVSRLEHVQLAMPLAREDEATAFYEGLLQIPRVRKPAHLAARGGCWFESDAVKVHLGVDADFRPATKAHPAFVVGDLQRLVNEFVSAGYDVVDDEPLEGFDRVYVHDPFGNRIELMRPLT